MWHMSITWVKKQQRKGREREIEEGGLEKEGFRVDQRRLEGRKRKR